MSACCGPTASVASACQCCQASAFLPGCGDDFSCSGLMEGGRVVTCWRELEGGMEGEHIALREVSRAYEWGGDGIFAGAFRVCFQQFRLGSEEISAEMILIPWYQELTRSVVSTTSCFRIVRRSGS